MKLKTKLIPIFTVASAAAVVAPLSSCSGWIRYTDLLHKQYESWVKPYEPTIFADQYALLQVYYDTIFYNTNILRDDILWSNSALLHNEKTKAEIDKTINYTEFNFDIEFSFRKVFVEVDWIEYLCADIDAHVAGTNVSENRYLVEHTGSGTEEADYTKVDDFDFHFNSTLYGIETIDFPVDIPPDPLLEGYQTAFTIIFGGACTRVRMSGTYSLEGSDEVKKVENQNEWFYATDEPERGTSYGWFGSSVLGLFTYATHQTERNAQEQEGKPSTKFISHYMKDATIKEQA